MLGLTFWTSYRWKWGRSSRCHSRPAAWTDRGRSPAWRPGRHRRSNRRSTGWETRLQTRVCVHKRDTKFQTSWKQKTSHPQSTESCLAVVDVTTNFQQKFYFLRLVKSKKEDHFNQVMSQAKRKGNVCSKSFHFCRQHGHKIFMHVCEEYISGGRCIFTLATMRNNAGNCFRQITLWTPETTCASYAFVRGHSRRVADTDSQAAFHVQSSQNALRKCQHP